MNEGAERGRHGRWRGRCFARGVVLVLLSFLLIGCATVQRQSAPWQVKTEEGPLDVHGAASVLEARFYWSSIMAAGMSADLRFRSSDGAVRDAERAVRQVMTFLRRKGHWDGWPDSQGSVSGRAQKIAPYWFHLIAIQPIVVVIRPYDHGPIEGRSVADLVGWPTAQTLEMPNLMNPLTVGRRVPQEDGLQWFSPDLGGGIMPVERGVDGLRIRTKRGEWIATEEGGEWVFARGAHEAH